MRPCGQCLLLLISACSSPDPPHLDPLSSGNVGVTVLAAVGGGPAPGATVVFVGADGNPVAAGVTGADGTARHALPAGGSVTVVAPDLGTLFTFLDLQPGDALQVGTAAEPFVGSVHVVPPGAYPGAAGYTLELGCLAAQAIDPAADQSFDLTAGCLDAAGQVAVLAHADDGLGHALAFSGAPALMPVQGVAEAALPAWQPAQPLTLQIASPQAWAASYDVAVGYGVAGLRLGAWGGSATAATATPPFAVPIPAGGLADQLELALGAEGLEPVSGIEPISELATVGAPAATATLDATALPPRLTRVDLGGTPARPQVSWRTERPYTEAAAAVAHLSWTGARTAGTWVLVGPALAPLAAPPLPAAVAPSLPGADVAVASLVLEDRSDAPSYHDWLARTHGQVSERAPARLGHALAGR